MAKQNYLVLFSVLALIVGGTFGFIMNTAFSSPQIKEVPNPVNQDLQNEVSSLNSQLSDLNQQLLDAQTSASETPTEVISDVSQFLVGAQDSILSTKSWGLGDDSDFLTCDGHEFDSDQVSIYRVDEWSYTWLDDDLYSVSLDAKLRFTDNSDERDCKESRSYTVTFEDGEHPVIE